MLSDHGFPKGPVTIQEIPEQEVQVEITEVPNPSPHERAKDILAKIEDLNEAIDEAGMNDMVVAIRLFETEEHHPNFNPIITATILQRV